MYQQRGLSLVELMISITLGIVLMTGVVQIFLSSKNVFSTQQGLSRIQEAGRLAVDFVTRDMQDAGYYGCVRPGELINDIYSISGLHEKFSESIMGYDAAALLPHGAAIDLGATITPVADDAHVLVLRSVDKNTLVISAPNTPNSVFGYVPDNTAPDDDGCVLGICANTAVVVSDCTKARVMQVSGLGVNGNTLRLDHPDVWGGNPAKRRENFVSGHLSAAKTIVYFLAEGASGQSSLFQKTNDNAALELIEGVEKMRITYAKANDTEYLPASEVAVTDWQDIVSVRIELVIMSLDEGVLDEPQAYTFNGATVVPDDRRMRQVFTSTVSLRNRVALR